MTDQPPLDGARLTPGAAAAYVLAEHGWTDWQGPRSGPEHESAIEALRVATATTMRAVRRAGRQELQQLGETLTALFGAMTATEKTKELA